MDNNECQYSTRDVQSKSNISGQIWKGLSKPWLWTVDHGLVNGGFFPWTWAPTWGNIVHGLQIEACHLVVS